MVEGERKKVGHACEIETSMMLYLRQELVDMSTAVKDLESRRHACPRAEQSTSGRSSIRARPVWRAIRPWLPLKRAKHSWT